MATESIVWPDPPATTNAIDGTTSYNMGLRFSVAESVDCVGVRWRVPDSDLPTPPDGGYRISLWRVTGELRLAEKVVTPVVGDYRDFLFDAPVTLTAGELYVVAIFTVRYTFRSASVPSIVSPSGNLTVDEGKLAISGLSNSFPASSNASWYYVSPLVEVPEGGPTTTPVTSTLTVRWRVYSRVVSSLVSRWRVFGQVASSLTARWRVYASVNSTMDFWWRVYEKVTGSLRARWDIEGQPEPPPVISSSYLSAQRAATAAFIANDPSQIVLVPRSRVRTGTGGYADVPGTPRAAQTVKMVLLNSDQRPTVTVAGVERVADYHLVGPWDMQIAVGDTWDAEDGTTWEVLGFTEGWDYMTKAFVGRHIPRESRP